MTEFDSHRRLERRDLLFVAIQQTINEDSRSAERKLIDFSHGLAEALSSLIGDIGLVQCHRRLKPFSLIQAVEAIINGFGEQGASNGDGSRGGNVVHPRMMRTFVPASRAGAVEQFIDEDRRTALG